MTAVARWQTPGQVFRFLVVGGINTVVTGALFVGLASIVAPTFAYTIAFASGVVFAVVVTPRLVFRARPSRAARLRYVTWYLTVYLVGLAIVYLLHDRLLVGTTIVAVVTFLATAGLSFLGARLLFAAPPDQDVETAGPRT